MACPLFIPSSPLGELVSVPAPLGDLYAGSCAADPSEAIDADTLRRYCNFGYARGHCERAAQSDADAVRFMVRSARGSVVQIAWAVERNHHPVAVGSTEVDAGLNAAPATEVLAGQAHACAAAYTRRLQGGPAFPNEIAAVAHT